eukprot:CAMPEP_0168782578 /NCGR_PEP_ID=MMETSP0725-20121227/9239_1 /TAXON_ID=265536 /ORGANISM="Amphiprora sp., Strain CCMP467" /LENGTH=264 /DNA_ID=CAMNT_0008832521 /DNA_START=301 /DNA_END=1095 /DNA_ORIENTATION=-
MASSSSPPGGDTNNSNSNDSNGNGNSSSNGNGNGNETSSSSEAKTNTPSPPSRRPRSPLTAMQLYLYVRARRFQRQAAADGSNMPADRHFTLEEIQRVSQDHRQGQRMTRLRSLLPMALAASTATQDEQQQQQHESDTTPSFLILSRWMSQQWSRLDAPTRQLFQQQAQRDRQDYQDQLEAWRRRTGHGGGSSAHEGGASASVLPGGDNPNVAPTLPSSPESLLYLQSLADSARRTATNRSSNNSSNLRQNYDWSSGSTTKDGV